MLRLLTSSHAVALVAFASVSYADCPTCLATGWATGFQQDPTSNASIMLGVVPVNHGNCSGPEGECPAPLVFNHTESINVGTYGGTIGYNYDLLDELGNHPINASRQSVPAGGGGFVNSVDSLICNSSFIYTVSVSG